MSWPHTHRWSTLVGFASTVQWCSVCGAIRIHRQGRRWITRFPHSGERNRRLEDHIREVGKKIHRKFKRAIRELGRTLRTEKEIRKYERNHCVQARSR